MAEVVIDKFGQIVFELVLFCLTTNIRLLYPSEETRITCNCTIGKIPWVTLSEQPFLEQTYNEKGQLQHCLSE
jgi:hypothetical protein